MPLSLLHRIARESLPLILTEDGEFEAVSVLVRAGHVEATMQVVLPPWAGSPLLGVVVHGVTRLGWSTLAASAPGSGRIA
ncbi:hypothetical protein [Variovorax soli]|uniref:Uncharacterized protein n=1 Tax=Variovorax soli TaxID=376815 RepID=A0ABU1NFR2_9BURK|nr:hypothetical protein [Variovorax soli]MDR6536850.1 hypothetical protein [Variovorax soli]